MAVHTAVRTAIWQPSGPWRYADCGEENGYLCYFRHPTNCSTATRMVRRVDHRTTVSNTLLWRGAFGRFMNLGLKPHVVIGALSRFVMRTRGDLPADVSGSGVDWNTRDGALHFRTFTAEESDLIYDEVKDRFFPFPDYVQS